MKSTRTTCLTTTTAFLVRDDDADADADDANADDDVFFADEDRADFIDDTPSKSKGNPLTTNN